jgi:hypothetical protein
MRALVCALVLVAGCHEAADRPLDPVWGKQPCDHCAMLVDEPRFAAQATTADGARVYFDDVGCLAGWLREHRRGAARAWVRRDDTWVPVGDARFHGGERTPMGYGYVAAGDGIDWSELERRLEARAATEETHAQ